jgi:CheY-like chemotaxis protein
MRAASLAAGANMFVAKPCSPEDLERSIREELAR